ncbi:Neurochondrin-domain-containing protein [Xylaria palmicola]|nr:Neurochondrin-domain-containing protein [Xylaria palmicola]
MAPPDIQKVHQLLAAKDDTSRFVGLLLLKTTLDNHAFDLQHEQVKALWNSISPKFLGRLIRTGSRPTSEQRKQSADMLDVAVAVIYTFSKLLNDCAMDERFYGRIPNLANAVLYSSEETTRRIVDLIHVLVQQPDGQKTGGATCFAQLDVGNWAPLIEIAPQHDTVFSIFYWAWIKGSTPTSVDIMRSKIDDAIRLCVSSFKGHNPTPLLEFITRIFDNLDPDLRPLDPQWLRPVARMIQDMASSKQTEDGRRAFIHCAAALLAAYPEQAPRPLFSDDSGSARSSAYLFVKMVQVDILSTLHVLIPKQDSPEYPSLSRRIAAALDIMTSFVGFLITGADDIAIQQSLTADRILKLHEDLLRTIGDIMEYLGDRWDTHLAGIRGIESVQHSGRSIFNDPIIPAAIRLIATWLRDDDGESLRIQAAGLTDLFAQMYKMNLTPTDMPELRLPILAALEGILQTSDGREAFNNSDLLSRCLYPDIRRILTSPSIELTPGDCIRGSAIIDTFHTLLEHGANPPSQHDSMDFIDSVAKLDIKEVEAGTNPPDHFRLEFQTDALEFASLIRAASSHGLQLQQKIRTALKIAVSISIDNWTVLNDKSMVARLAKLNFD